MDSAFGWLGQLIEWFGRFVPRLRIVNTTLGAVKFVHGRTPKALGPGLHWYWPLVTEFSAYPTARQANALPPQTLMTSDGRSVAVSALIVYKVEDIELLVAHTFDPDNTVEDIAQGAVHDVLSQQTWEQLFTGGRPLYTALRQEAQKGLSPFGVKVLRVSLIDLVPCRTIRLMQSGVTPAPVTFQERL
ncbi:hypothetical protein LCGC14_0712940 [marine sediment metagenome]|uniref:Band 7 domain-containing protein n=1 Tax=marine sediment metagenome TaxID=412755 RepID=A0A0F9QJ17_9ZZZZ